MIDSFAPHFHNHVVTTIAEGDRTFARIAYTGTLQGAVFGVPASGARFEYAGAAIFTIRDELISEVWVLGDIYRLLQQIETP